MSNPAIPGPSFSTTGLDSPPPMPSIVASALAETWQVLAAGRRTLAVLVGRL